MVRSGYDHHGDITMRTSRPPHQQSRCVERVVICAVPCSSSACSASLSCSSAVESESESGFNKFQWRDVYNSNSKSTSF